MHLPWISSWFPSALSSWSLVSSCFWPVNHKGSHFLSNSESITAWARIQTNKDAGRLAETWDEGVGNGSILSPEMPTLFLNKPNS